MKWSSPVFSALLAVAGVAFTGAAIAIPNHVPTAPQGHGAGAIGAAEATAFVNQQFADYFVDCQSFADSFHDKFKYCDGAPCYTTEDELLTACWATEGAPNTIHTLRVLPSSENPTNPDYAKVTAVGLQTVYLALDPAHPTSLTPLCFDFAIREDIIRRTDGLKSTYWGGFYRVSFGVCSL